MEGSPNLGTAIEDLRDAMRTTSDPRAARTRRAILDAVQALASEGNGSMNVTDVVVRAGISRSAFYTQFSGIESAAFELLAQAFADIAVLDREARRAPGPRTELAAQLSLHRLVTHFADNRPVYAALLDRPETAPAYARAIHLLARELATGMAMIPETQGVSVGVAANFIAGGILAVLRSWCEGETPASVGQLVEQINGLLPPWLASPVTTTSDPAR